MNEFLNLEGLQLYDQKIKQEIKEKTLPDSISTGIIDAVINNKLIEGAEGELTTLPARFLRIEFNEIYASKINATKPLSACLTELKFYDENNNIIRASSIIASSVYQDSTTYAAEKLIDSNTATMWSSKNIEGTHWLEVSFAEPVFLSKISIAPRKDVETGVPNILSFYASKDKAFWYKTGYFENLKDTWVNEKTFQDFVLNPYKENLTLNRQLLDLTGFQYYHNNHSAKKADIDSPIFAGTPQATTPEIEDTSDRIATTKFVKNLIEKTGVAALKEEVAAQAHEERMREWSNLGLGLFIHWGVYAAWDGKYVGLNELGEEVNLNVTYNAEWLMHRAKIPAATYKTKSSEFTGEFWNAEEIARMAYQAGMKYIVITSKHHEGFSLFSNPNYSSWDIDDTPCRDTVLQELKDACDRYGLKFCLYFSQCYDWTEEGGFGKEQSSYLGQDPWTEEQHMAYLEKTINSIKLLIDKYNPFVLWYDMGFSDSKYYKALYEAQELYWPNVITNDRLAQNRNLYGDFRTSERVPSNGNNKYSEACFTLNNTWGYNSTQDSITGYNSMTPEIILKDFILNSLSVGQNCLLNIGPKANGVVPEMQKSRLRFLSKFFQKYGVIQGGQSYQEVSYPDWGIMVKTNDNTLKCFVFEPKEENKELYGFDPTYISSVRVFDAADEYSSANYEITEYGIKLLTLLNSLSYTEKIDELNTTITNDANLGVVEIKFNQPIVTLQAKPLGAFQHLSARCFSLDGNIQKKYRTNTITMNRKSSCYTEFIWTGDSGAYNILKNISVSSDDINAGELIITNCINKNKQTFNLANESTIEPVLLAKGVRYSVKIVKPANSNSETTIFTNIYFEPSDFQATYTEVDHITAKNYQYINTEFNPTSNTKLEVDFMSTKQNSTRLGIVAGLEDPKFIIGVDVSSNKFRFDFGTIKEKYTDANSYTILNNRHIAALDKGKCYIDGEEISALDMSSEAKFAATSPIFLFADSGYLQDGVKLLGNMYSAKIWDNDVLVRDFVPVRRDFDGVYGMLDKVNNKFYSSATSIGFTCE